MSVTLPLEPRAHLDLLDYKENWDRKVTKELPVSSVKVLVYLAYLAPRVLKESTVSSFLYFFE